MRHYEHRIVELNGRLFEVHVDRSTASAAHVYLRPIAERSVKQRERDMAALVEAARQMLERAYEPDHPASQDDVFKTDVAALRAALEPFA